MIATKRKPARSINGFPHKARPRMRTILVPTDYSNPSRRAFELACRLAANGAGRLTLLHVAEPLESFSFGMADGPPLPAGYRGAWESQLRLIRPSDPAVQVDYRIEEGDPAAAILRAAGRTGCDLIVMGTRPRSGLARLLWPGVTGRVLRQSRCPVLTLTQASAESKPSPDGMLDYRTILHPTDFSRSAMHAFGMARDLARASGGELLVVHVASTDVYRKRGYRRDMDEALNRLTTSDPSVRMRGMLLAGDPVSEIITTAGQLDSDLIVMGATGRTGLGRLWHGSVAGAVQNRARCPVLTAQLPQGQGEMRWDVVTL